jgi:hypothetical protein
MPGVEGAEREDYDEREARVGRRDRRVNTPLLLKPGRSGAPNRSLSSKYGCVLDEPLIERDGLAAKNALYFVRSCADSPLADRAP